MDIYYLLLYFFVYGFLGWCAEVAFAAVKELRFVNRGFLNGPICPIYGVGVTIVIAFLTPIRSNLILLYITSVILVTLLEGLTGWAMDKIFHNKWWDYSNMPFNIGGYVCLVFSLVWGVACVAIMDLIHPPIHQLLTYIPRTVGILFIVILGVLMFADLYVTASAIFQFNKRLASMEKIASELHEISDQLGENIYEKAIFAMEKQEESKKVLETSKQKLDDTASEIRERTQDAASEIRERTQDAASGIRERTQDVASNIREKTQDVAFEIREKGQDAREFSQDLSEELRIHISELRTRYNELKRKPRGVANRLMRAFPQMESRNYKEQLNEFRRQLNDRREK